MTCFEFQLENYVLFCTARDLRKKALKSYEQMPRLFAIYLKESYDMEDVKKFNRDVCDNT